MWRAFGLSRDPVGDFLQLVHLHRISELTALACALLLADWNQVLVSRTRLCIYRVQGIDLRSSRGTGRPSLRSTVSFPFGARRAFPFRLASPVKAWTEPFTDINASLFQASTARASTREPRTFSSSASASTIRRPPPTAMFPAPSASILSPVSDRKLLLRDRWLTSRAPNRNHGRSQERTPRPDDAPR